MPECVIFSPHLTAPTNGQLFNRNIVTIEWRKNDPPGYFVSDESLVDSANITYEIEYTDNYDGGDTVWRSIQRRIPWETTSYIWTVGKMIKSSYVRVRIRARDVLNQTTSDWSMSDVFSVNVFDLVAPVIISPTENKVYTDYIWIIWDETPMKDTFHQKVRYTLDYSSESQNIDWTIIAANIPIGQNMIRWDISDVIPAEDYVIRLTARDVSTARKPTPTATLLCQEIGEIPADQIAVQYVYNIKIRHSGMFIIDTVPPVAKIQIEGNTKHVTNKRKHILNIFADDATTQVETVRLSNCDADNYLPLGKLSDIKAKAQISEETRCPLSLLLNAEEIPYSQKIEYELTAEESGFRKIQALLSDTGGNLSIQKPTRLFFPFFETEGEITDFVIYQKDQDTFNMTMDGQYPIVTSTTESYEIMCVTTSLGEVWILDPFPRLIYSIGKKIDQVFFYSGLLYFFTHSVVDDGYEGYTDLTEVWREAGDTVKLISPSTDFKKDLAIISAVSEYHNSMIIGFENGEMWAYDGIIWSLISSFSRAIKCLNSDDKFLYIGFQNSSEVCLYNGTTIFTTTV